MIGSRSMEQGILGQYANYVRQLHPDAPIPGVYLAESLFEDAKSLRGDMGYCIPAWLSLSDSPTQPLEGFQKKGFNVVRLESPCFGPLHILSDTMNATYIHCIMGKGSFLNQILDTATIECATHHSGQSCTHLRLLSIPDRLDQQLAQRFALELEFSENIEHLASKSLTCLFYLFEQGAIHITLPGFLGHQIP